jgi:hypothetical protein
MTTDSIRRPVSPASPAYAAPAAVDRLQTTGLVAGVIGLLLCALGWFVAPDYFFRGYLVGWVFWIGVSLGCMATSAAATGRWSAAASWRPPPGGFG